MSANRLRALQEERRGYVNRGLKDRVAQVDAQIKQLGGNVESPVIEKAVRAAPVARQPRK